MSIFNLLYRKTSLSVTFFRKYCSARRRVWIKRKRQCFYDTLELNKECSSADIRNAYLKLSKQYHPDINQDKQSHQKFLEISEAYNVLSKPLSKRDYDAGVTHHFYEEFGPKSTPYYTTTTQGGWSDDTFWEYRNKSNDHHYKSQPYYGIKGVNKISNAWIVLLCLGFTTIGVALQFLAIKASFTLKRNEMDKRSAELEKLHAEIRERALRNGDQKQIEIFLENVNKSRKL